MPAKTPAAVDSASSPGPAGPGSVTKRVCRARARSSDSPAFYEDYHLYDFDSSTNFVLARVGSGRETTHRLRMKGFIVRPVDNYGLPQWVRISVGTEAEMERLKAELQVALR